MKSPTKITRCDDGMLVAFVDTWYDRGTRSWVTQVKDAEGNQIADALYAGNAPDARADHSYFVSCHNAK
jgi:hypothetical protein